MNIQWDAEKYTNDFSFVHQYGSSLLDLIEGENLSVLDLGCGDGLYDWIRMFVKAPFEGISPDLAGEIVRSAVSELKDTLCRGGNWYADYVRLRCRAVKPPA